MFTHVPPLPQSRVKCVTSFDELISTPFRNGVNALCWPRTLEGDFAEVADRLPAGKGISHLNEDTLRALPLSEKGRVAAGTMLADLHLLRDHGLDPSLDCVNGYTNPIDQPHFRTDVCSFHADSATAEADTWLCTYHGPSSEGLPNEEAVCRIDIPKARSALLSAFGGHDDEYFLEWLSQHYHDLHYSPLPDAYPYHFGVGNLWRIAIRYPGCPVPPCIHRAPEPIPGQTRLLLIS